MRSRCRHFPVLSRFRLAAILLLLALLPATAALAEQSVSRHEVFQWLSQPPGLLREQSLDWTALRRFYALRDYQPVWLAEATPAYAGQLLDALERAYEEGLGRSDYHYLRITRLLLQNTDEASRQAELLLSDAMLRYARDLKRGRLDPARADPQWVIKQPGFDAATTLAALPAAPQMVAALAALAPTQAGYRALRRALAAYRQRAERGPWPVLDAGPSLHPGERQPRVRVLRRRLELPAPDSDPDLYDAGLEKAVRAFQRRHGLHRDGVVGRKTRAALNVPIARRILQLRLNMERWRWLPDDLGERYLLVILPGFRLLAVEQDRIRLNLRVIIGRAYRSTPSFSSRMSYLVINPDWNVPQSIARLDLFPAQGKDPAYFSRKNIRIFSGWGAGAIELSPAELDWNAIDSGRIPYHLRQEPGPHNALGRIKFMFPNPFSIYLHDTPERGLFERESRTFSSGCIRVEFPFLLADFVVGATLPDHYLTDLLATGETARVPITQTVRVHAVYFTAWVDEEDEVNFWPDIYDRDVLMERAAIAGAGW